MNVEQAKARADVFKALSHPTRVLIVDALRRKDFCLSDFQKMFGTTLPTISRHVNVLKKIGIVTERRAGPRVMHHLACPCMLQAIECTLGVLQAVKQRQGSGL